LIERRESLSKGKKIQDLLQQGFSTLEIMAAVGVTRDYVSQVRWYLKDPVVFRKIRCEKRKRDPSKRNSYRAKNYAPSRRKAHCSGQPYSQEEDLLILGGFEGTDRELALKLGRSVQAIQVRRVSLPRLKAKEGRDKEGN
jgi:hypothetical protein